MDKPLAGFDWNQVRAFLATVEAGSLSAAAGQLGQSQPTIGRQVASLEADLGVTLFERVGRSLQLTAAGVELLQHVREMGEAANRIALVASGQSQSIDGHVRITASDILSAYLLPDVAHRLKSLAPGITVEVLASNEIRDLQRREADIAVRHVRPEQPELIARLLGDASARFYADKGFLDRIGRPENLAELSKLPFVGFGNDEELVERLNATGLSLTTRNVSVTSESGVVAWEMVRRGLGVGIMSDEIAEMTPGVEVVLPEIEPLRFPVWLAVHRELRTSRRIRLVFDLLAEVLSEQLAKY